MLLEKAKQFLRSRALAYRNVFLNHGIDTDIVLLDLAKFCRAHKSTFHPEPSMSDRLDGRREVWLRIQQHLRLNDHQLWELYGNKHLPDKTEGDG